MLTMIMVALVSCSLTACNDDDDDEEGGSGGKSGGQQSVLVGTWKTTWDWQTSSAGTSGYDIYTFKADGTGTLVGSNQDYYPDGRKNGAPYTWNESFRWELVEYDSYLKTGTVLMRYTGSSNSTSITFILDGNKLTIGSETYIKQ